MLVAPQGDFGGELEGRGLAAAKDAVADGGVGFIAAPSSGDCGPGFFRINLGAPIFPVSCVAAASWSS